MSDISIKLIEWFNHHQRILPWRDNAEPYPVWISEIMLQQTRVQAVIPYYDRFLARYPNIQTLAATKLEDVLHAWQGLGFYARARHLHQTAQLIRDQYSGQFPSTYKEIIQLPGIGKYTAAAILSIAFGQPYPVMDGNVMRVMARLYGISTDIRLPKTEKQIEIKLHQIFSSKQASAFNQGMMELGALICLPKQPKCDECPLNAECQAFQSGKQLELPNRSKNPQPIIVNRIIILIRREDEVLIHLRKDKGLLASMWEFPGVEASLKTVADKFEEVYGFKVRSGKKLFDSEHVFTHRHWKMRVYQGNIDQGIKLNESEFRWVTIQNLEKYPIPNAFKVIVDYCRKEIIP